MSEDDITAEQRLGDVAATLLTQLELQRVEFATAGTSLALLARYSSDVHLAQAAEAARLLSSTFLAERVRDVAATLPLRGLEFGEDS